MRRTVWDAGGNARRGPPVVRRGGRRCCHGTGAWHAQAPLRRELEHGTRRSWRGEGVRERILARAGHTQARLRRELEHGTRRSWRGEGVREGILARAWGKDTAHRAVAPGAACEKGVSHEHGREALLTEQWHPAPGPRGKGLPQTACEKGFSHEHAREGILARAWDGNLALARRKTTGRPADGPWERGVASCGRPEPRANRCADLWADRRSN